MPGCRLKRELQSTGPIHPEAEGWQPPSVGFNLQEGDIWMRLELHDAALVPVHLRPAPPPEIEKLALGEALRKSLTSLSSGALATAFA